MKYIDRFSSLIPATQGNMAVRRVEELKEKGEIQTEAEYTAALQDILSTLSTTELKPLFSFVPIQAELSSSEHFNLMMDQIRDDLEVVFIELNNIFAAIKAHDTLFKDKLLDELHFTLRELENTSVDLSVIADPTNAFDEVLLNSFSGDNFSLNINSEFAKELLFDRRKNIKITSDNLGFIDPQEQAMSLPLALENDITFVGATVKTADTTATEINIQLIDSDIKNLLDNDTASGWAYNILLKEQQKEGAKLSLELDLGDKRDINFLRIHPISDFPLLLEKIEYINANNNIVDLPDTTYFNRVLEDTIRITFPDILAKKIILRLSQSSSVLFDHDKNQSNITFDDLRRDTDVTRSVSVLTENIQDVIIDPDLLDVLPLTPAIGESFDVYNQYIFAFRDISAGLSSYKDDGYFVSKAYNRPSLGLVGLDVIENIPEYFDDMAAVTAKASSYEYDVMKKDYNGAGELIQSFEFPILPAGTAGIDNERLFFESGRTVIPLRFLGHTTSDKGTAVDIYRNNILLTRGPDWRFFDRANSLDDADDDLLPNLLDTRIEILHSNDVIRTGIYTAEYAPRFIDEPNEVVTLGNMTYLSNGVTEHPVTVGIEIVETSDIFMKVATRNNSFFTNRTPKLEFYRLLVSSVDSDKYVRLQ